MQKITVILLMLVATLAHADDYDKKAPFNGLEFNDPRTHKRTIHQEQMELMRLHALANMPFVLPGVPSTPSCDKKNNNVRY